MKANWSLSVVLACSVLGAASASGADPLRISYPETLARARQASPDLLAARSREGVASSEIGIAGTYPNPIFLVGTSTRTAKLSVGVTVPLHILGQRGAAVRASRADYDTVRVETQVAENDVKSGAAHAFVSLWLAERTAEARLEAANVGRGIEVAGQGRVSLGAAPETDGLRARAEQARAEANAREAEDLVGAAAVELGRWLGIHDASELRTAGDPVVPARLPTLANLLGGVQGNPSVRRELADARAAELRAVRERALVRPAMALGLGADAWDPTLDNKANYRLELAVEMPLFNQRGSFVEREERAATLARTRAESERIHRSADLAAAYRTFQAISARKEALASSVLPAAEAAARTTRDSYQLGRATLEAMFDAERTRIDTKANLLEADAARAHAFIELERAQGRL
jgi:outer membrane protein, heavy metal efflux system